MATVILSDLGLLDPAAIQRRYAAVQRTCARSLAGRTVSGMRGPGAYACGELLSISTMAALPDADLFGFWRRLLRAASEQGARIDTSFYLYALGREGVSPELITAMERFTSEVHADPDQATLDLLTAAGLDPEFDAEADVLRTIQVSFPER